MPENAALEFLEPVYIVAEEDAEEQYESAKVSGGTAECLR